MPQSGGPPRLLLFNILLIQHSISSVIKSVNLTTINTNQNDASIVIGNAFVDVNVDNINEAWDIYVGIDSQKGYHLEIDLNNTWGFHATKESAISFTMHSSTTTKPDDLDVLVTFSVNNNQYITALFAIDGKISNRIYPALCDTSSSPTVTLSTGDIKQCVDSDNCGNGGNTREDKATGVTGDGNYVPILPNNYDPTNRRTEWLLTISLVNNPITDTLYTTISNPSWNGWTQSCGYGDSFATNSGLQIYIGLDDADEQVSFTKFDIKYSYNTDNPTSHPTTNPTGW